MISNVTKTEKPYHAIDGIYIEYSRDFSAFVILLSYTTPQLAFTIFFIKLLLTPTLVYFYILVYPFTITFLWYHSNVTSHSHILNKLKNC